MSSSKKRSRRSEFEKLDGNERAKLLKRARNMRKAAVERPARRRSPTSFRHFDPDEWEEGSDRDTVVPVRRRTGSLEEYVDRLLDEDHQRLDASAGTSPTGRTARVVHVEAGRCRVRFDDGELRVVELSESVRTVQRSALAVGDFVEVSDVDRVETVLPRSTRLSRPDPHNRHLERVLAANVDVVGIVSALISPPLRPNLIDRFLVAIERGGAQPVIVVNKVDLAEDPVRELSVLDAHRALGIPVIPCSAERELGLDPLRDLLRGRLSVFVGHSGVGKSSLLNALDPAARAATGAVTDHAGKGRHTTTSSTLYDLGDETLIIDTPGIRSFGLDKLTAEELIACFPEIEREGAHCRFNDCTHRDEPACAVREASETGRITERRYRVYRDLLGGG
ncbi:MAG: ribosome small subunit-dependent GTPase A [Planctomycetes bacterium]|nr:ribosome small subunit-dependent GTPase A [Planctomycetota bacterium]